MRKKTQKYISRPDHVLLVKRGNTTITYDSEADAAYFRFQRSKKGVVAKTTKLDDWVLVDFDKEGNVFGIEMLFVSQRIPKQIITTTFRSGKTPIVLAA